DKICSTHTYADRVRTLAAAKKARIEPCSGLILGMGERSADVIEVSFRLRELEVPSIPVNFLIPIEGNPVQSDGSLTPERCLRALCLMRLVNPRAEIRAAGGREGHLRGMEALALWPANSLFVEGYLTTRGDSLADTYRLIRQAGREVLLFAGSNYLDLARHPAVVEASARAAREIGCAAGGSRLISGNLAVHEALEEELAKFFEAEAALSWSSGYAANLGVIPALVGRGDAVVSDALSHASIIDGCRLSRAEVFVFPHGDLAALEAQLGGAARTHRRVLLAIDGVYSMDGDVAPVAQMVALAKRHGAIVLLDDAHGTGTLGARG